MSTIAPLPEARVTGHGTVLVPGSWPKDRALPITGGILQTRSGPVPVAGQIMTAEGPVIIAAAIREATGGSSGSLHVVEQDRRELTLAGPPNTGGWTEDMYRL